MDKITEWRNAGATEDQINAEVQRKNSIWRAAGATQEQIDAYWGRGPIMPSSTPQAYEQRLQAGNQTRQDEQQMTASVPEGSTALQTPEGRGNLWDRFQKYLSDRADERRDYMLHDQGILSDAKAFHEYFGDARLGWSEETNQQLQKYGIVATPGKVPDPSWAAEHHLPTFPLAPEDEAAARAILSVPRAIGGAIGAMGVMGERTLNALGVPIKPGDTAKGISDLAEAAMSGEFGPPGSLTGVMPKPSFRAKTASETVSDAVKAAAQERRAAGPITDALVGPTDKTTSLDVQSGQKVARLGRDLNTGAITEEPVGGLPTTDSVNKSTTVITGDAPAVDYVKEKLVKTWSDQGRHPAEVATDAQRDPVVAQRTLAADKGVLPYVEEPHVPIPRPSPVPGMAGETELFHGSGREARSSAYNPDGDAVPVAGPGKYFAFDESHAREFGPNVEKAHLADAVQNPLVINDGEAWRALTKEAGWEFPNPFGVGKAKLEELTNRLRQLVQSKGHDGIVIHWDDRIQGDFGPNGENLRLLRDMFDRPQVVSYRDNIAKPPEPPPARPARPTHLFKTAKGSEYEVHDDGTTSRNKAIRQEPGHENDFGPQPRSEQSYYLTKENMQRLAPPAEGEWRIIDHGDGTVSLATKQGNLWGISPLAKNVPVERTPKVGLQPLELWQKENIYGHDAYRGMHPGNDITEIHQQPEQPPVRRTSADLKPPVTPPDTRPPLERAGPPIPPDHTRLYRAEPLEAADANRVPQWIKESPAYKSMLEASGRWFSADAENLNWYIDHLKHNGIRPKVTFVDVPNAEVESHRVSNMGRDVQQYSRRPEEEFFLPRALADQRRDLATGAAEAAKLGAKQAAQAEITGPPKPEEVKLPPPIPKKPVEALGAKGPTPEQNTLIDGVIARARAREAEEAAKREGKPVEKPAGAPAGEVPPPKPPEPPKPPAPPPGPPTPPPTPPPARTLEEAQAAIAKRISVGERGPSKWAEWSSFQGWYQQMVDGFWRIHSLDDAAYVLARLTRGSVAIASDFLEYGTRDFFSKLRTGASLRDILKPVKNDIQHFREYITSKRALEIELSGRQSGLSAQELEDARQVVSAGTAKYDKVAQDLTSFQNRILKYLKDSGMLTDEAYQGMLEGNKAYIPFYRLFQDDRMLAKGMGKSLGPGNPIKMLKGSKRDIVDPLESIIKNTYLYVTIAHRNAAGIAVIDALKAQGIGTIIKPAAEGKAAQLKELADFLRNEHNIEKPEALSNFISELTKSPDGDVLSAYKNGVKQSIRVQDPLLVQAFRQLDEQNMPLVIKIMGAPARALRAGAVLTPDFMARNITRDLMTAFINTSKGIFHPLDTLSGLKSVLAKDEYYHRWIASGGANAAMVSLDRNFLQDDLAKLHGQAGIFQDWNVVRSGFRKLRLASELLENATRVAEYARQLGYDLEHASPQEMMRAGYESREITLDFARIGAKTRAMNMITAFWNAQVQGTDRMIRQLIAHPGSTMLKIAAGLSLPSIYLEWAQKDDPRIQNAPAWARNYFWLIATDRWVNISEADAAKLTPEQRDPHLLRMRNGQYQVNNGTVFRIPKPFEPGIIFGSGAADLFRYYVLNDKRAFEGFTDAMVAGLLPGVIPTFALPVMEQWTNRSSFTDRTLIPHWVEKQSGGLPQYEATPYTTQLAKKIGQVIGSVGPIEKMNLNSSSMFHGITHAISSPILIENYVREWSGGLGMYALQGLDLALRKAGQLPNPVRPNDTLADVPFIKAFVLRNPSGSAQAIQDFYDAQQRNTALFGAMMEQAKAGRLEGAQNIMRAGGPQMMAGAPGVLQGFSDALNKQAKFVRDIYDYPNFTADQKRQMIDRTYWNMIATAKGGLQLMDKMQESGEAAAARRAQQEVQQRPPPTMAMPLSQ